MGQWGDSHGKLPGLFQCFDHACFHEHWVRGPRRGRSVYLILSLQGGVESVHARLVGRSPLFCSVKDSFYVFSTVSYPACTNSGEDDPDSDCGSTGWAYSLFIAWNLLSMVGFVAERFNARFLTSRVVHIRQHVYW